VLSATPWAKAPELFRHQSFPDRPVGFPQDPPRARDPQISHNIPCNVTPHRCFTESRHIWTITDEILGLLSDLSHFAWTASHPRGLVLQTQLLTRPNTAPANIKKSRLLPPARPTRRFRTPNWSASWPPARLGLDQTRLRPDPWSNPSIVIRPPALAESGTVDSCFHTVIRSGRIGRQNIGARTRARAAGHPTRLFKIVSTPPHLYARRRLVDFRPPTTTDLVRFAQVRAAALAWPCLGNPLCPWGQ